MISMRRRGTAFLLGIVLAVMCCLPVFAATVPQEETPDYKVAFYASSNYHLQDANGRRYGYGYDMMEEISRYMQCTFSYEGYEKTPAQCEEMLRSGQLDIYTAAKITEERQKDFAFSTHPAITATTCMNVKRGNGRVVSGDYSTYEGIRVGLLERHTYNSMFLDFAAEKGFQCEIVYYQTPTELSGALINEEVDALVNSYIRTPEDEITVERFGETPYYFMARKEDQELLNRIDRAIDEMNLRTPNWRIDLYNQYYGAQASSTELTDAERGFLQRMQEDQTVIRGVMNPDNNPYSWYSDGVGCGILADLFTATVESLGLDYELIPVSSKAEYQTVVESGEVDIWLDVEGYYQSGGGQNRYTLTETYLTSTLSLIRRRSSSGKIGIIGVCTQNIDIERIVDNAFSDARIVVLEDTEQCVQAVLKGDVDCALMMSLTAQQVASDDLQNRFLVEILPESQIGLRMGINSNTNRLFFQIWEKTLLGIVQNRSAEIIQTHLEQTARTSFAAFLFDYPIFFMGVGAVLFFLLLTLFLYIQTTRAKNRQLRISEQLTAALAEAKEANDARLNFFSKMSHDIRTPLNAVLGMTQIAKQYKADGEKLDYALDNITSEGNYLLTMINSILDVNQLAQGHMDLLRKPFSPHVCMQESLTILQPLLFKRMQTISVFSDCQQDVVVGDPGRFSQIIVNIVSNAIKYTGIGGKIQVRLEALPEHRYRFTCTDNGIGMDKEYVKHICEDYSRAEDSRTSAIEGTGLGMSVVKGFTDLMNGTLSIKSELGVGSTFTVEIPFLPATEKEQETVLHTVAEQDTGESDFRGRKVLLVEDNALNAEIASELLQILGLEVDQAENGQIGVEKFTSSEPGSYFAVFMDLQMPVMDGIAATRRIRASSRADQNVAIIAMTANTLAQDRKRCEEAGMNGYLTKPISLQEIENVLKELL